MLLSYALFVASAAATALSSSQLEARKAKDGDSKETGNSTKKGNPATDQPSDENIPKDEPFCLCIDLSGKLMRWFWEASSTRHSDGIRNATNKFMHRYRISMSMGISVEQVHIHTS